MELRELEKDHRRALKELRDLEDEVILPTDKGNATVVMKRSDYDEKTRGMLDDTTTYRKLRKDPTATQDTQNSSQTAIAAQQWGNNEEHLQ